MKKIKELYLKRWQVIFVYILCDDQGILMNLSEKRCIELYFV